MSFMRYAPLGVLAAILSLTSACAVPVEDVDQVGAVIQAAESSEEVVDLIKFQVINGHDGDKYSGILPCVKVSNELYSTVLETGHKSVAFNFAYTSNGDPVQISTYLPVGLMEELGDDPNSPEHVWIEGHIDLERAIDDGSVEFKSVRLIDTPDIN